MSLESVCVKSEPEWETSEVEEQKPVQLEVEPILPRVTSVFTKTDPDDCSESEGSVVKSEIAVEFKEEPQWCDARESAIVAYVNNEAVYGPELLKLLTTPMETTQSKIKPEHQLLKPCSVRIERMRAEKKKKPYICKICYKIFDLKTSLFTHLDVHSAEELHPPIPVRKRVNKVKANIECDICGQKCASRSHLSIHYRKHTGEKPYACKMCDKSYSQRANLLKHELCHTGEKPYSCNVCMKRYSVKLSLVKHTCVPSKKTYPCEICKLQCNSKLDLIKHIEVHTEQITCGICSINFKDNSELEHHMLIHTCLAQMRKNFRGKDLLKAQDKHFPPRRKIRGGKSGKPAW